MRFYDAVMRGCELAPRQAFGAFVRRDPRQPIAACALGAARLGTGSGLVHSAFPFLRQITACPECDDGDSTELSTIIAHLNDKHRWTREQIALWASQFEPALPGPPRDSDDADSVIGGYERPEAPDELVEEEEQECLP